MTNICKILRVCRATSLLVSDVSLLNLVSLQNKFKVLFLAIPTNICELAVFKSLKEILEGSVYFYTIEGAVFRM